ncbi:MAG: XRE family transcriptional regulator [Syntrophales bacterium LBB04]|nr:XRE family transcriptional regulator [Syntrophales bacterium LBB04]
MKQKPAILESAIGKRINAFRKEKRITLDRLAEKTGFTKGYLSRVEKSQKAPPVSTLGIIGRALGVTISALLGEESPRASFCLVRKNERPLIARDGIAFGYSYESMAYKYPNRIMEPFMLTLPPRPKKSTVFQHEGEEILFVIQGTMKFFHGTEEYIVNEGDCIYFDSGFPHFGESVGREEVKCFMVIYNPTTGRERTSQAYGTS